MGILLFALFQLDVETSFPLSMSTIYLPFSDIMDPWWLCCPTGLSESISETRLTIVHLRTVLKDEDSPLVNIQVMDAPR